MTDIRDIALRAILCAALTLAVCEAAQGQGCVAVRPMSCGGAEFSAASIGLLQKDEWRTGIAYQQFTSFRHFRGDHEEAHRVDDGTEVINRSHSTDLGLEYGVSDRFSLALNLPIVHNDRSSLYEHYGNTVERNPDQSRFSTGSFGQGDLRLSGGYWLFDPMMLPKGNLSLGLGIKFPTGDSNVQDTFHKVDSNGADSLVTRPVDQSIQPGDGGWGFTVETEGYRGLFTKTSLYFNGFYLFNPREVNDTKHNATTYHSVADQFGARVGLDYALVPQHGLSASLGGRIEGIPSEDLIGGSEGRRRPGYIVSVEPGLSYSRNVLSMSLNVPVALYRNRTQSLSDKQRTAASGEWVQGDAAFADYLVNFTISARFGAGHSGMESHEH